MFKKLETRKILKTTQIELLRMKITIREMKNRLDTEEERLVSLKA